MAHKKKVSKNKKRMQSYAKGGGLMGYTNGGGVLDEKQLGGIVKVAKAVAPRVKTLFKNVNKKLNTFIDGQFEKTPALVETRKKAIADKKFRILSEKNKKTK